MPPSIIPMKRGKVFARRVAIPNKFHTTRWNIVLTAAQGEDMDADAAFENLCRNACQRLDAYARR